MKCLLLLAFGVLLLQQDRVVPVHEEPRHRMVYETSNTRVLDIQIPPGDTTLFHTHRDAILYVTMSTSRTRGQDIGAADSAPEPPTPPSAVSAATPARTTPSDPPGRMMSTTTYVEKPQTHRVSNIGESLFRLIGVTNPSTGDDRDDPSVGFDSVPEISNRWFRGYRYVLTPGESQDHRHANPVALVLVGGAASIRSGAGAATPAENPGFVAYVDADVRHTIEHMGNGRTGDTAAQLIEVEVRRPR